MGSGILPAEHRPLGKHGQAAHRRRTAGPHCRIGQYLIKESQVDGVVVPVEGHGVDVDGGVDQLRRPDLSRSSGVQNRLGLPGQVHPQILDAVLIPAGIGDLLGMDGQSAAQILRSALQCFKAAFTHGDTS